MLPACTAMKRSSGCAQAEREQMCVDAAYAEEQAVDGAARAQQHGQAQLLAGAADGSDTPSGVRMGANGGRGCSA